MHPFRPDDVSSSGGRCECSCTAVGGAGMSKFVPVLGGDGTKIAPPADLFDQPPGEMRIQGKLADHVRDHAVLSPVGVILVTSPRTESSYPHPPYR